MPFRFRCLNCGDHFDRKNSRPAKFCSHSCAATGNGNPQLRTTVVRQKTADARRGTGSGDGYIKRGGRHEHRVVAEIMLGRPLAPGEIVAHKDRKRPNNEPENLEIFPSRADFARALMLKIKRNLP